MLQSLARFAPYLVWLFCAQDLLLSICYLCGGKWQLGLYWLAGAAICATVPK